ncbi:hypothetical protein CIRMBP1196_01767 [Enterococcus cecorum]|nr:hypothetical protein [Enterococcus cecorum]CAI3295888.1 hypothetical protein CIRMBP1195_00453 [Enterococcus cecorum]CAI3374524.1 hypothetical protein CIRMBP1319_00666 [Enterococcus cecorum]CAI3453799.1 hypothetical protein CIRMBP1196_01767 [Enterococcus cecorum]
MKIPKRPNYKKKPYPTREEQMARLDFDLFISLIALIISIICYLTA